MATISKTTRPKARKAHRCGECGQGISPGDTYTRWEGLWDGVFQTAKTCHACETLAHSLYDRNFISEGPDGEECLPYLPEVDYWRDVCADWPELAEQVDSYLARCRRATSHA